MKTFKIPVTWECWGLCTIEADSLEQAKEKALNGGLPSGEYLENSFKIDEEGIPYWNNSEGKEQK